MFTSLAKRSPWKRSLAIVPRAVRCNSTKASSVSEDTQTQGNGPEHWLVKKLNHSLLFHPLESFSSFVAADIITLYGVYSMIKMNPGLDFSSQFVFAFSCARIVRRVRFPLDVATAKVYATIFPHLQEIQITKVLQGIRQNILDPLIKRSGRESLSKRMDSASDMVNRYGVSYLLASRTNGVLTVLTMYQLSVLGFDVSAFLQDWGLGSIDSAGEILGPWAASVVATSSLFPLTSVIAVGYVAPFLGRVSRSLS